MTSLTKYLADVHARGIRVLEHPKYGGVNNGLHMAGSMHAKGRAGDLNYGPPGMPPEERPWLLWAARLADAAGLNVIYAFHRTHPIAKTNAAHRDHLHVDDGPITAYKAPGRNDALYRKILAEKPVTALGLPQRKELQRRLGFKGTNVDGVLGANSYTRLQQTINSANEKAAKLNKGKGFLSAGPLVVDGLCGPRTETAIVKWLNWLNTRRKFLAAGPLGVKKDVASLRRDTAIVKALRTGDLIRRSYQ